MKNYILSLILLCSCGLTAQLDKIETEEMSMVTYNFGHKYILGHAGRCFHNAYQFHKKLFDYKPTGKVSLLIQDFGDYGNGGATAVPNNAISMGLSPFSYAFETSPAGERVFSMINHELVHVIALDNATKSDLFFRRLFMGKVGPSASNPISMIYSFWTNPRRYSPRWYHEGIAAYVETWMSGGLGLALGSYDEMVFRTKILEDGLIYSAQGLESEGVTSDFQGKTNSYLYGTRFMGFLAYTYSPEQMIEWVKRAKGSKAGFAGQFKNVFGKRINEVWDNWIEFERKWQTDNINTLNEYPVTEMTPITDKAIGSVSYAHHDEKRNCIYVAVNNPGKVPHLAKLDLESGKLSQLTDIKGAALFYVTSLTFDKENDILYFTTDNDSWRDLNSYNIVTKETKLLQKDFRTGDLAFNKSDKSIWGIKHLNGFSTIIKIDQTSDDEGEEELGPYGGWDQVYTFPYGHDIFDIDISPDGKLLSAAVSDLNGNQDLLFYDIEKLLNRNFEADTVFNFAVSSPQSFRFSEDGKYMYGTSFYTGVSNVFRVEVATQEISAMTNAVSGYFRPTEIDDDRLFAFNFTSKGFQPVYIQNKTVDDVSNISFLGNITVDKHPQLIDWTLPILSADELDMSTLITKEGKYESGKEMKLNHAYPIVVGYKNNFGIGYNFNISDPFNFKSLDFSISFTPKTWNNSLLGERDEDFVTLDDEELIHFSMQYKAGKYTISGAFNEAEFHDLFGPSQGSRKGARLGIFWNNNIKYDPPTVVNFNIGLSGFYGLDQSPEFQQILASGFNRNLFVNLSTSLSYSSTRSSLGATDSEKGIQATIHGSMASSEGISTTTLDKQIKFYPRVIASLNYGIQLPGKHFSLWLRTAAGSSFSKTLNPFTRFGFGAFGNNYVDYQSTRQYRSPFSFPGVSYSADKILLGQRFAKATAEFVLPAIRFRKLGGFNFFANWIQPAIFSSILYTDDDNENLAFIGKNKMANVGAQLDLRMVTFSLNPSTLSFGYAKAWNLDGDDSYGEWMISLKLLH